MAIANLYDSDAAWHFPNEKCPHEKQFYCQECLDALPDDIKEKAKGAY